MPWELPPAAWRSTLTIGIVADTHGLLRPEIVAALAGCDGIIHAGDLGKIEVYEALSCVAPTVAIRGNVDRGSWAKSFPETLAILVGGVRTYVLHDLNTMAVDPVFESAHLVVSGHSHRPAVNQQAGVLYLNPGSAGPRRFSLPVTLAKLEIGPDVLETTLIDVLTQTSITRRTTPRR